MSILSTVSEMDVINSAILDKIEIDAISIRSILTEYTPRSIIYR